MPGTCKQGQIQCADGTCVSLHTDWNDGIVHCSDGIDEGNTYGIFTGRIELTVKKYVFTVCFPGLVKCDKTKCVSPQGVESACKQKPSEKY